MRIYIIGGHTQLPLPLKETKRRSVLFFPARLTRIQEWIPLAPAGERPTHSTDQQTALAKGEIAIPNSRHPRYDPIYCLTPRRRFGEVSSTKLRPDFIDKVPDGLFGELDMMKAFVSKPTRIEC